MGVRLSESTVRRRQIMTSKDYPRAERVKMLLVVIFTHFKLWVAVARHNLKWVKIARIVNALTICAFLKLTHSK